MAAVEELKDGGPAASSAQELKRSLSLLDLVVYGLVFIAPIAPFGTFGIVFNASHGMVAMVYLLGLAAMAFTAISYAAMSETFPVAGSVYSYATHGIGPRWGLFAGWALLLDYLLVPSFVYVICAVALHGVIPGPPTWTWVVGLLGLNTLVNLAGVESTARSGLALLVLQLGLLAAFFVLGAIALAHGTGGARLSLTPLYNAAEFRPQIIFAALSLAATSFLGFDAISTLAEEAKGGPRVVGRATLLSLALAALLFVAQTWLAGLFELKRASFPPGAATDTAFYEVATLVGGQPFKWAVSILGVLFAGVSGALAAQAATARLLFGMARDRRLPGVLAHVSARTQAPDRAILLVAGLTLVVSLAMVDRMELLAAMVNFGALTGFVMLHASVLVHHGVRGRSRAWFSHVVSPLIGMAILGYVLANAEPVAKIAAAAWLALGLAVLAGAWLVRRTRQAGAM
jgi:amino acid transporter